MSGQKHRTQILLESIQHKALVEIAEQEERSLSDLMRSIIQEYLEMRKNDIKQRQAMEAIDTLNTLRTRVQERVGVYQSNFIAEVRTGREE